VPDNRIRDRRVIHFISERRRWDYAEHICSQSHRISQILRIIVAIPIEIVITRIERFGVFAHETAQRRVVSSGAVFIESERRGEFPASEEKSVPVVAS